MASSPSSIITSSPSVSQKARRFIHCGSRSQKHTLSKMSESDATFKDLGNQCFADKNYEKAIEWYSKAISKNPTNPVYFTNRALAAIRLKRFDDAIADCLNALELKPELVKGHYYLGIAHCEMNNVDEGLTHIRRANGFAIAQKNGGVAEALSYWLKRRLEIMDAKEVSKEMETKENLTRLITEERDRKVDKIKMEALGDVTMKIKEVEQHAENSIRELNALFRKAEDRRKNRKVPDYLSGKITLELLKDPVITPSGITYERSAVEEVLERVGHSDPLTGTPLVANQLIPNLALKDAAEAFVKENEWAQE